MCKNKKGGKKQRWYLCKTTCPGLASGCPHFHHLAPHLWLVPCVSGSTAGQISLLLLCCTLLKGFYFRRGKLWGFLSLSRPSDPGKPHCFLALLVLPGQGDSPAYATGSCVGSCCSAAQRDPLFLKPHLLLALHCHPFFLVFHDDEEEKGLPGWLVGRGDFPAIPPGHLNISAQVLPLHLEALQSTVRWGDTPRTADTKY